MPLGAFGVRARGRESARPAGDFGETGDRRAAGSIEFPRKARSQATAVAVLSSFSACNSSRVLASLLRQAMPMAPCATAGSISSVDRIEVTWPQDRGGSARQARAALHRPRRARAWRARLDIAAEVLGGLDASRFTCAWRRSDELPTTAPGGSAASDSPLALMKASRTSPRFSTAAMTMPGGRSVGKSFMEWTARSTAPLSSASSISLVNSPLPPKSQRLVPDAVARRGDGLKRDGVLAKTVRIDRAAPAHGSPATEQRATARADQKRAMDQALDSVSLNRKEGIILFNRPGLTL